MNKHKYTTYCNKKHAIFCTVCVHALQSKKKLLGCMNDAFVVTGCDNWHNISSVLANHNKSDYHQHAVDAYINRDDTIIQQQLKATSTQHQLQMRENVDKIISAVQLLSAQGSALRGDKEGDGNLNAVLYLLGKYDHKFKKWLDDTACSSTNENKQNGYRSHGIINEFIDIMRVMVIDKLVNEVVTSKFFGIISDCARDIRSKEQLALCIRYVDTQLTVHEVLIDMVDLQKLDAAGIVDSLKKSLEDLFLNAENIRGQGYDGASVMSGERFFT